MSDPLHHDYLKTLAEDNGGNVWWKVCGVCLCISSLIGNFTLSWTTWKGNPAIRRQDRVALCRSQIAADETAAFDDLIKAAVITHETPEQVQVRVTKWTDAQYKRLHIAETCK